MADKNHTYIAYRCPECSDMIYGLVGEFALSASMLRLRCSCGESVLDIKATEDKKIKLSVPCPLCRQNHNYVLSNSIFFTQKLFTLTCPYSNTDIGFIGEKDLIDEAAEKNASELTKILASVGAAELRDIQPVDINEEDVLPDAQVYDCIRFVVKELEAEGSIICPCKIGDYDIRYAPGGIEVVCNHCSASYLFENTTPALCEEYLKLDKIELK